MSTPLLARAYNSGFALAHDTYNGISAASDGRIYYVLSSESLDVGGQMYVFDPETDRIQHLGDLTEACGEKSLNAIPQGKSHVSFVESQGTLYFATHIGYYSIVDGMEKMDVPPPGYGPYPGGHLLAFHTRSGSFTDLAMAPESEGILTMNMDAERGRIYGLTWPTGYFFTYDLASKQLKNLGPTSEAGENGTGDAYRTLCRAFAIDPRDGSVFMTVSSGQILRFDYNSETLSYVEGDDLRKDYFGSWEITSPGHMAYNWRQVVWYPPEHAVYGVHGNSGYLFRFVPSEERVEVLDRITSMPSRATGMFDQFSYGYLGFALGPDGRTLYYLTGGPIFEDGRRVRGRDRTAKGESKGEENLHLITYDIPARRYTDHGPIFFTDGGRPSYVNSIAIGKDGAIYALSRVSGDGDTRTDLIAIASPL
jgi:hypothetical protein